MKHGKRPSVAQQQFIRAHRTDPQDWLVERDTPREMVLRHRYFDKTKVIKKEGREDGS